MLCALSGVAPEEPVASKKSGNVFEKRLIESYISENHKDPVNGEELETDDLIALQSPRVVKPRPPTLTSIPSLLSTFQNEWDALMLESYALKQTMYQLKQELSTALYENDAAIRVISRLTKERNEARDALSKMSVGHMKSAPPPSSTGVSTNAASTNGDTGDAMQLDGVDAVLPEDHVSRIDQTQARLSQGRRKRPIPESWAGVEKLQTLDLKHDETKLVPPGSRAMSTDIAVDKGGFLACVGGVDGSGCVFNFQKKETMRVFDAGEACINDCLCIDFHTKLQSGVALATGEVKIFDGDTEVISFSEHAGSANALALHPAQKILVSVGDDKSVVFYDIAKKTKLHQFFTENSLTTCQFHPDGALLAAGSKAGTVSIYTVKSATKEHTFEFEGPIKDLSFSENGLWLAVAVEGSSTVEIVTLSKMNTAHRLEFDGAIDTIKWDYTGQYLAGGGKGCVSIHAYNKSAKSWSKPFTKAANVTSLHWGPAAKGLVILNSAGAIETIR